MSNAFNHYVPPMPLKHFTETVLVVLLAAVTIATGVIVSTLPHIPEAFIQRLEQAAAGAAAGAPHRQVRRARGERVAVGAHDFNEATRARRGNPHPARGWQRRIHSNELGARG